MSKIEIIPLYSGSSGNSTLLKFGASKILVDLGKSTKQTLIALEQVGVAPEEIDAILVTHGHSDHICGIDVFIRKYNIPIYCSEGTLGVILRSCKKPHSNDLDNVVRAFSSFEINSPKERNPIKVTPLKTSHDSPGSQCYMFEFDGSKLAIATDLGYMSEEIRTNLIGSDIIMLESNFDIEMLHSGPYPFDLKRRIEGRFGHLSNYDCACELENFIKNGTRRFILAHLSAENNVPELAYNSAVAYLSRTGFCIGKDYDLIVAKRHEPTEGYSI